MANQIELISPVQSSPVQSSNNQYNTNNNYQHSSNQQQQVPVYSTPDQFRQPNPFILPPAISSILAGSHTGRAVEPTSTLSAYDQLWIQFSHECFNTIQSNYLYTVCPFKNVTQKSLPSAALVHVSLGVFDQWNIHTTATTGNNDDISLVQSYTDGNGCSSGKRRSTTVHLKCTQSSSNTVTNNNLIELLNNPETPSLQLRESIELSLSDLSYIHSVSEPETCQYSVHLHTPIVCPIYESIKAQRAQQQQNQAQSNPPSAVTVADLTPQLHSMRSCMDLLAELNNAESEEQAITQSKLTHTIEQCRPFIKLSAIQSQTQSNESSDDDPSNTSNHEPELRK